MSSSANFRAENQILFSLPLLRNARIEKEVQGRTLGLGPIDILDVNKNQIADVAVKEGTPENPVHQLSLGEPVIGTQDRPSLQMLATLKPDQVVTQDQLAPGYLVARQASMVAVGPQSQIIVHDTQPLEVFAGVLGFKEPEVRYAVDLQTNEFLLYRPGATSAPPVVQEGVVKTASGLEYEIVKKGSGEPAKIGQKVKVHYVGTLAENGQEFDSSRKRNQPFEFKLGAGQVIRGWDEGVEGMLPGEVRKLKIPSQLGYGERGAGKDIPPGADLRFEVEYLAAPNPASS